METNNPEIPDSSDLQSISSFLSQRVKAALSDHDDELIRKMLGKVAAYEGMLENMKRRLKYCEKELRGLDDRIPWPELWQEIKTLKTIIKAAEWKEPNERQ